MANLIPLYLDKDTGQITAKSSVSSTAPVGYLFGQAVALTQWIITHNQANTNALCQIYDLAGQMIIPDNVTIATNTITVDFVSAQAGSAKIMFFTPL